MTHAHTTLEKHPICETPIDFEPGAARNYVKKVVRNPQRYGLRSLLAPDFGPSAVL